MVMKITQEQFDELFGGRTEEEDILIFKSEADEAFERTNEVSAASSPASFIAVYKGWITDLEKIPDEMFDWIVDEDDDEQKSLSLRDIYCQAVQKNIIKPNGSLVVIIDSPAKGYIYECGNYGAGKWTLLGKTKGYA